MTISRLEILTKNEAVVYQHPKMTLVQICSFDLNDYADIQNLGKGEKGICVSFVSLEVDNFS